MVIAARQGIKQLLLPVLITYLLQVIMIIITSPLMVIITDLIRSEAFSQLDPLNLVMFTVYLLLVPWYLYIWVVVKSLYTTLAMVEVRVNRHSRVGMVEQANIIEKLSINWWHSQELTFHLLPFTHREGTQEVDSPNTT